MKPNNFFVICFLPLQFTHITFQHVPFQYLKGFFRQMKGKKVMGEKQNDEFAHFYIFLKIFF